MVLIFNPLAVLAWSSPCPPLDSDQPTNAVSQVAHVFLERSQGPCINFTNLPMSNHSQFVRFACALARTRFSGLVAIWPPGGKFQTRCAHKKKTPERKTENEKRKQDLRSRVVALGKRIDHVPAVGIPLQRPNGVVHTEEVLHGVDLETAFDLGKDNFEKKDSLKKELGCDMPGKREHIGIKLDSVEQGCT